MDREELLKQIAKENIERVLNNQKRYEEEKEVEK